MLFKRLIGGTLESNGYILYIKEGRDCLIIDPGYNPDKFIKTMKEHKLNLIGILLTHHHYDHVGGVKKITDLKNSPVYMHRADIDMYKDEIDVAMEDGHKIQLDGELILALHTPGHTEGSVCYYYERGKMAFTGDTIFNVDLGRTDLKDGDPRKMDKSIRNVIDLWENEVVIYPGHGDSCNMKFVRRVNKEFIEIIEKK